MKQKKSYIEPKIKAIKLNPEHAVLNVCAVEGQWMTSTNMVCTTFSVSPGGCGSPVRDQSGTFAGPGLLENAPS